MGIRSFDAPSSRLTDEIDALIVSEMARDAHAKLARLADLTKLSVSAVQARLRRLETRGIITGYRAVLDPEAVGKPLTAFIEITPLDPAQADNAPEKLLPFPEIEACHSVAGSAAYMLLVRVASPRALEDLIRRIRSAAGVSTRTTVVLQTFFENRPLDPAVVSNA